jgi:acetyltransferase-like isoleucine patch superfamily enzyme
VLVAPQGVVGVNAVLGDGAIVNTLASVDHDCCLGDFSHVSAGVHMAGGTKIESHTFVGVGATVIKNVCSHCTIGAGAVVVKDITEKGTYVGVPAKRIM